jgi:acyl dehydratase
MNEVWKKPPISLSAYQNMAGHEVGVSSWHLVDQNRINLYADVIEDHQFIHIDPERAKRETAFGTTVAHGFLTMSLLSIMSYEVMPVIEGTTMGVNYGFDKLRFISPVRSGSRVRGRFTLAEAKLRKPTELLSRTNVTVEINTSRHTPRMRGIQYAAASRLYHHFTGILDRPVKPGDDGLHYQA